MLGISEEELYNLPTAEFVHRRVFIYRQFTVFHVAFHACADLKNVEVLFLPEVQFVLYIHAHMS